MPLLKGLLTKVIYYNRSSCQRSIQSRTQSPRALWSAGGRPERLWNNRRKSNFLLAVTFGNVAVVRKVSSHWILETIDFNRHYCFSIVWEFWVANQLP